MMSIYVRYCNDKRQQLDCFNASICHSIYVSKTIIIQISFSH